MTRIINLDTECSIRILRDAVKRIYSDRMGSRLTIRQMDYRASRVHHAIEHLGGSAWAQTSKLRPTGDAHRDRLVAAKINLHAHSE